MEEEISFENLKEILGTIHLLRKQIFRISRGDGGLRKHVYSTENKHKLAFPDPLPPTSAYVIYKWSPSKERSANG